MDDVRFNEQIVIEKVGWKSVVGVHAANTAGGQKDDPRPPRPHPVFDLGLASQVDSRSAGIEQQSARFAL
jgi:hypothetical protein